jgi:integrase
MARNLYRWFSPAAERADVGWAAFQALRHTAATRWLLAGVSIAQVSRLLGHADAGFTLRVYVSVLRRTFRTGPAGGRRGARVRGASRSHRQSMRSAR